MEQKMVHVGPITIGKGHPLALIAGPCVIENDRSITFETAARLKELSEQLAMPLIFKSSFDKANRTSIASYRGPGLDKGLEILAQVKERFGVPVISDVHGVDQIVPAAKVLDVIQLPAFLCRQTDLIVAAADSGRALNIKKGQFLAPRDMINVVEKARSTGNDNLMITERGVMFGYNNLVVDFRSIAIMKAETRAPVIFDATHSIQEPGGLGGRSGGKRHFAPILARAAVAAGADGVFMEVHPDPDNALCDGPNSIRLDDLASILKQLLAIRDALAAS
jgi:2-dehydro-3-deoxyphosphooctonate aldolase (KDO 8-P synthase)